MITIDDVGDLPAPKPFDELDPTGPSQFRYLRSAADESIVIECMSGDTYQRRDGQPWPDEGYKVSRDRGSARIERTTATAFCGGNTAKGTAKRAKVR